MIPRNRTARSVFCLGLALALFAPLGAGAAKAKKAGKDKEEEKTWDVSAAAGYSATVKIDTTETTWSSVDVSPDGRTVLFDMLGDLYTVPLEGGEARALTQDIAWNFQGRYSPDGARIAFISDRGGADNLWVMNADGGEPRALTEEKEHLVHNPAWSPDGEYIAVKKGFTSTRSIPAGEIWMVHVGGGGGLQLVERPNKEKDQKTIAEPAFSADGRWVYYSQDVTPGIVWQYNKDSTGEIFAIKRLDRERGITDVVVSGPGGAIRPTPSPDGRKLAFVKRTPLMTSALYVKDLASGTELPLYTRLDRDLQETNGSQGNTPAFAWTPDSEELVFWAGGKIRRARVADAGGDTTAAAEIPIRVRAELRVHPTVRFPVDVAPDEVPVRMLRWTQVTPDGSKAVFGALGRLWVVDLDSGERRRLTAQTEHFEYHPAVSRDGRYVVYTTWDDQKLGSVSIVPIDGGRSRTLTGEPGHYVEPAFSPDGERVVYRKMTGGFLTSGSFSVDPGLWIVDVDGGQPRRIGPDGFDPHFGADGERIYFSDRVEETKLALKSVDLDGHEERTHLVGATALEFSVSPDGRWVAFTEQFKAYVAPFPVTGKSVELGPEATSLPVRQVSKRAGEFLHWSADARKLHWSHGPVLYTRELKDAFAHLAGAPEEELPEPVAEGRSFAFTVPAEMPNGRIALTGARIVTMRDAEKTREVIERGTVLVAGNRIAAVGPSERVEIPADARRIDVGGATIVPGLIDVHAHGAMAASEIVPEQNWQQLSNLAFGVTTIHDPSNDTSSIFAAAEMQRAGDILAPRIFSTGTILYGAHSPGYFSKIDGYDDALFHVQRLKDAGAISVKSYQQPRRDQRQQVIAAGQELGIMVVPEGGAKFEHNMNEIVDGHTGIEHAVPLAHVYDDVAQLWSATGTGYTPTFGVAYGGLSGENYWYDRTEVWKNERLMAFSPRFIIEPRAIRRTTAPDEHYNHVAVARHAKRLRDLGVTVHVGAHGQREGLAAHWEMWMMAQGGFSPWEALRAGTIDGARYLGLDGDVGSIEAGKLADLVVIQGNPLEELRRSEQVRYTMLNGRLYEAATMDQVAPEIVEREPLFFELPGGDTVHPATMRSFEEQAERHGWLH